MLFPQFSPKAAHLPVSQEPRSAAPWRAAEPNPFTADGTVLGVRSSIVQTHQLLRAAAVHLIRTGCGEGWLLQPKLQHFETSEYR